MATLESLKKTLLYRAEDARTDKEKAWHLLKDKGFVGDAWYAGYYAGMERAILDILKEIER